MCDSLPGFELSCSIPPDPDIGMEAKATILLIEDNENDEILTLRALRKIRVANRVEIARDGAEAIERLLGPDAGPLPQVVLLDLKLPKLDGIEVLKRLRADRRTRALPVVILTSSDEDRDRMMTYDLGANSYIRKPVDSGAFLDAVAQVGLYWLALNRLPPELDPDG